MEIIDYMKLYQIRYEHTAWQLFRVYLKGIREAITKGDVEKFRLYRKGYDVLRQEESFEAYHRIYRMYVLNQKLNYPVAKERQLIAEYQAKEEKANQFVNSYNGSLPSYGWHLTQLFGKFILVDISQLFLFLNSGIASITLGIWIMSKFGDALNIIGGVFFILIGLLMLRRNFAEFVRIE